MTAKVPSGAGLECDSQLDLYWIPLGAGQQVVRTSGAIYEACAAALQRRPRSPLYHSALVARVSEGSYFMEMTPVAKGQPSSHRGVVGEGAVGSPWLGRFAMFRYELRRWLDGAIPDLSHAVDSPVHVSVDETRIRRVLALMPLVPRPVWGRDELHAGEMWNSNSVISWMLSQAGLVDVAGHPPRHGRAPGWDAGVVVARRSDDQASGQTYEGAPAPIERDETGRRRP
jgi:hypothetical protein